MPFVLALLLGLTQAGAAPAPPEYAPAAVAIRELVGRGADPRAPGALRPALREELDRLYIPGAYVPLWIDAAGRASLDARTAIAMLRNAAADGLEPDDYLPATLADLAAALAGATDATRAGAAATFDVAMSASVLTYIQHLHRGRIDPRTIGFQLDIPVDNDDFAAALRPALAAHRVVETAAGFAPPLRLYQSLRDELSRYRALADDPRLERSLPATATVKPGGAYLFRDILEAQLIALGDMPSRVTPAPAVRRYEGAIVDGVRRFQLRHGLATDGVVGKTTLDALRVPIAWRVRQIELALERLRWLPHLTGARLLAVNIPMFQLWGWDAATPGALPSFTTSVVVGKALSTETPVFAGELRQVIFRPYWNVPSSIVRGETIPAWRRDSSYFEKHGMEVIAVSTGRVLAAGQVTEEALRSGELRVRQKPGPSNALGLVKFVIPNDDAIYLHDTPSTAAFSRARRDFSHGCVRVADPAGLAEWVLASESERWTRDRVDASLKGADNVAVTVTDPIQIILFYVTAVVMPESGELRFADDIYRHDMRLDRALRARPSR